MREMPVGAVVSRSRSTANGGRETIRLETVSPVGNVSVNATPVSGSTFAAGFVMVNVSEVVAFSAIVEGLNTFAIDGGASTLTLAEAVPPVPPSVEVTLPVVLFCSPAAMPVTFTENAQEVLGASVAPLRLITFVPAVAVIVPPPQDPVRPFGVETTRPAGSVSLKPTPVSATVVLLFWMVKLRLVEPFSGMLAAPKDFNDDRRSNYCNGSVGSIARAAIRRGRPARCCSSRPQLFPGRSLKLCSLCSGPVLRRSKILI